MGSCVSLHRDPESAVKFSSSIMSKNEKILIPLPVNATVADASRRSSVRFPDAGSKDEAFFDSQPWLESDCEDDYFSVNGDFASSRGNSPVRHSFSLGNPQANIAPSAEDKLSPPDKRKRLLELFRESRRGVDEEAAPDNKNEAPSKVAPEPTNLVRQSKSTNGTSYFSRVNSRGSGERTPSRVHKADDKSFKTAHCCLPRLLSSRSFSERKSRMSLPRTLVNNFGNNTYG